MTSCTLTPSSSQSLTALDFVRFVVPKHGMVTHRISFRLRPARSNARTHTSSASVLSNPPEIPSTTVFACVCSSRFLSPCDWMRRIASARARSCSSYGGTNGLGAMCRVTHSLARRLVKGNNLKAGDRVITRRAVPLVHEPLHVDLGDRQGSAPQTARFPPGTVPFSAIRWCREKTMSCVDSVGDALQ